MRKKKELKRIKKKKSGEKTKHLVKEWFLIN